MLKRSLAALLILVAAWIPWRSTAPHNVLLICVDCLRADALSCMAAPVPGASRERLRTLDYF